MLARPRDRTWGGKWGPVSAPSAAMNWWLARLGMIFSFPTIAVNYVKGVSPHAYKGEEDDQHPYDGTVLLT